MKHLKRFNQLNESVSVSDDLKSNFRSWESDHDNEEDAEMLAAMLIERHPDEDPQGLRKIAYEWVGLTLEERQRINTFDSYNINEKESKPKKGPEPWWKKYTKYELSAYPVNIPEEDVTIDTSGDIDSHPVMTWNSPKTGKKVYSYTRKRMEAQKAEKYGRVNKLSDSKVEKIKVKCHEIITSEGTTEEEKQAAAVVSIIAQTGLRPGSREGFEKTENRGVLTLGPDNVKVKGDKIELDFRGKSYKENEAEIEDGALAHYLSARIKEQKGEEFLFDVSKGNVDQFYKKTLNMEGFKIKDLRTFIANKIAKWFLNNSEEMPPPVPSNPKDIKKAVKTKLKHAFEYVSHKLNNTPAMAKNSYVNPAVINDWLSGLGIKPAFVTEEQSKVDETPVDFHDNAPVYDLPNWWEDDDIELVKEK